MTMKTFIQIRQYFTRANQSSLEKRLVLKLDFFILTFCCLAYFTYRNPILSYCASYAKLTYLATWQQLSGSRQYNPGLCLGHEGRSGV